MILWTDYGESFLRVSLEVRRGFLRDYEQASYAAIGRIVVEGLLAHHAIYRDRLEVWDSPQDASIQYEWTMVEP